MRRRRRRDRHGVGLDRPERSAERGEGAGTPSSAATSPAPLEVATDEGDDFRSDRSQRSPGTWMRAPKPAPVTTTRMGEARVIALDYRVGPCRRQHSIARASPHAERAGRDDSEPLASSRTPRTRARSARPKRKRGPEWGPRRVWPDGDEGLGPSVATPPRRAFARRGEGTKSPLVVTNAVVVGAGPNGLAAAVTLARAGASVVVLEAGDDRRRDPGRRAHASGVRPRRLLRRPPDGNPLSLLPAAPARRARARVDPAAGLGRAPARTIGRPCCSGARSSGRARELGRDASRYRRIVAPLLDDPHGLLADLLGPLGIPAHPASLPALRDAGDLARRPGSRSALFRDEPARAALGRMRRALDPPALAADDVGASALIFALTAHVEDWPVARGGSIAITRALASYLGLARWTRSGRSIASAPPPICRPPASSCSTPIRASSPRSPARRSRPATRAGSAASATGPAPSRSTLRSTDRDSRGPIRGASRRRRSTSAARMAEIAASERAMWRGEHAERPVPDRRAAEPVRREPRSAGKHTGYAYCHVPHGSTVDRTDGDRGADRALRARAFAIASSLATRSAPPTSSASIRTTSAVRSPAVPPIMTQTVHSPGRPRSTRTPRRIRGSGCARPRPRRAEACTVCAGITRPRIALRKLDGIAAGPLA